LLFLKNLNNRNANMIKAIPATAAATPIPAFAPVDRPPLLAAELFVGEGEDVPEEVAVTEDPVLEDEEEENDVGAAKLNPLTGTPKT
jgi:hypothetical protein